MNYALAKDNNPWYVIRLFSFRLKNVESFFEEKGLEYFVPMHYEDVLDENGHPHQVLKPVVGNLVFVKKTMTQNEMRAIVAETEFKMSVYRKNQESSDYYEIPAKQMFDFQMMCNPEMVNHKFMSEDEAKLKKGTPVLVKYGPLSGLTGKLVRSSKKYYLLKEVPGLAVMLKVTRWCCVPIEEQS